MMSRLIAKGIIRSYSMRSRGRIAVKPNGIVSNCSNVSVSLCIEEDIRWNLTRTAVP